MFNMQIRFKNNDCLCLISQMPGSRRYIFFIFLLSILIFLYFSIFRFLDLSISIFYYFSISVFSLLSMNYIFSICYLELNSEKYPHQFLKIDILKTYSQIHLLRLNFLQRIWRSQPTKPLSELVQITVSFKGMLHVYSYLFIFLSIDLSIYRV